LCLEKECKEVNMTDPMRQETPARRRAPDTLGAPGQRLRRRRMSAKRKQSAILRLAILRLLRGEELELVSRDLG
jgi:hypothetical protein